VLHSEIINRRGSEALYECEVRLAEAENALDLIEQKAFIRAEGTVADRTALSRLEAADARLQRDLRKAEANRVRVKIRSLESALMATATQAKLMQAETRL
jgi:NADPH-dependent 7-cyano-7-deazaguanine reductase QueF-like protein